MKPDGNQLSTLSWLGSIDPQKPRSRQLHDVLLERIESGNLLPGAKLPTELQLMQHFDVSRTTVSRAMRDLELHGFVQRRRGSGTYVKQRVQTEQLDLSFFVPWVESGVPLPYVEGLIHQRLADIASQRHSTLILKCYSG